MVPRPEPPPALYPAGFTRWVSPPSNFMSGISPLSFSIRPRGFPVLYCAVAFLLFPAFARAQILLQLSPNSTTLTNPVNADYSSTHLFIDEINGDSIPITVFFNTGTSGVDEADV